MKEGYYHTKASVDEYVDLAKDVNGQLLIDELKKVLPQKATVLELGSGPGSDWEILSKSFEVTGSDYSKAFINRLKRTFTDGQFVELDAVTLKIEQCFDAIYSNKVLHHLNDIDLENSVKRQADILNSDGMVCHSFWKGEGTEVFKGLFVNYHQKEDLQNLFSTYFDILSLVEYEEFEAGDSLLLLAKKKQYVCKE